MADALFTCLPRPRFEVVHQTITQAYCSVLLACAQALYATDDEMARLDMSDLPSLLPTSSGPGPQPPGQPGSPQAAASLAAAVLDLLPGRHSIFVQRSPAQEQAAGQDPGWQGRRPLEVAEGEKRSGEEAAGAAGVAPATPHVREEEPSCPTSPPKEGAPARLEEQEGEQPCLLPPHAPLAAAAPSLATRLYAALARFLSAAATSGTSIAELTATGSSAMASSRSGSADSLYSARSGGVGGEAERYHSCTASDLDNDALAGPDEVAELLPEIQAEAEAAASSLPAFSWHELP